MKSIIILCIALAILSFSTAFSLAVFEPDGSANATLRPTMEQVVESRNLLGETDGNIAVTSISLENSFKGGHGTLMEKFHTVSTKFQQIGNVPDSPRQPFEPASIFLFGVGLIGVAIFTRRKFSK